MKWPRAAAKTRRSIVEALTSITVTLTRPTKRGRPTDALLREALYLYGLNPRRWSDEIPADHAAALAWLETASFPVVELDSPAMVRRVLDSLCVRLDGKPAAASTVQRKRATFYNVLGYAVELELIASNPVDRVQWTAPEVAQSIDRRVVANPAQVATLLEAVKSLGKRADKVTAFFGCLYYAGMRPRKPLTYGGRTATLPAGAPTAGPTSTTGGGQAFPVLRPRGDRISLGPPSARRHLVARRVALDR